jgi:hypothetical protein
MKYSPFKTNDMKNRLILLLLINLLCVQIYSQCDSGGEPECTCETAEVLCSVGELDGFSSSMSTFQHPDDGPSPFCGGNTQTNNPTWFAFIAWCTDITLEVEFDNCTTAGGFQGAQLAVYTDCSFNEQVDCDSECNDNSSAVVEMDGLTIGESYYVMLDGCFGSACDYEVSVSPTDCNEFIEDWEEPVTEDLVVCIGQTVIYDVDELSGATNWHWYLDGDEVEITDVESYEIAWAEEGQYELCVDVSNICLEQDEDPEQNCVTITVGDPDAGQIEINDSPECPQEFIEIAVSEYNMDPLYESYLIIVNSEGEVVQVVSDPISIDFTWPTCDLFTVYSLNFPEAEEELEVPDVGDDYEGSDCILFCCSEVSTMLAFEDEDLPEFDRVPSDITLSCYQELFERDLEDVEELETSDDCADEIEVIGTETINADTCNGGTIIREWFFADACDNEVTHTQTITILPWQMPDFIDMPGDTSMTKLEFQNFMIPDLDYSNNLSGDCLISGSTSANIEDNSSGCGGFLLVSYEFIDPCGNTQNLSYRIQIESDAEVRDTIYNVCDIDQSGIISIERSNLNSLIANDTTGLIINYYATRADLMAETNQILFPISNMDLPETIVYATVIDNSGCNYEIEIEIRVNDLPSFELLSEDESCLGNNDGVIQVNIPSEITSFTLTQSNDTLQDLLLEDLPPGLYEFTLTDSLGCKDENETTINSGIEISFIDILVECNNNNTGTDNTDDFYNMQFTVTGGSGQYRLELNNIDFLGNFEYDQVVQLTLPADGDEAFLSVLDLDPMLGCLKDYTSQELTPCSNGCAVFIDELLYDCNDNGTPLNGSDDFYSFSVSASAINQGIEGSYNVLIDGNSIFTFNYNEISTFDLPASGSEVTLEIQDSGIPGCTSQETTEPLIPCSNMCQLDISLVDVICIDPFTPADNDDDLFEVVFTVSGINASSAFSISGIPGEFSYGEEINLGDNLIADGDLTIEVTDSEDMGCSTELTVMAPQPCSTPCELTLVDLNILECNNNGTGNTSDDDFYFVEITIDSILGTGDVYNLSNIDNTFDQLMYNTQVSIGPFPSDGSNIVLNLSDNANGSCFLQLDFSNDPCSSCDHNLSLSADILVLDCENTTSNISSTVDDVVIDYAWVGPMGFGSDLASLIVDQPGEYMLTVTFADNCQLTESITIDASQDMPISIAGEDMILNCETPSIILDGSQSTYGSNAEFNWLDSNNNVISQELQLEVTEPGTYGLQIFDRSNNCTSEIDFVEVLEFLNQPQAIIYAEPVSILDCNITSIELSYEEEVNVVYTWLVNNQNIVNEVLVIEEAQSIGLIALDTVSLCETEGSIEITDFEIYPSITIDMLESIDCISGEACVSISSNTVNDLQFAWLDNNGIVVSEEEFINCFQQPGQYSIKITDLSNGCQNTESFVIEAPVTPEIDLPETITVLNEEEVSIEAVLNIPEQDLAQISWQTNAILSCYDCLETNILEVQDSTVINFIVVTNEGCEASAEVLVRVRRVPKIYVPNVFSLSSGEGFTIFTNADINVIEDIYIYDRWGNLVFFNENFAPNDNSQSWDGRYGDQELEQGVFVYVFRYMSEGRIQSQYGTITLVK